MSHVLIDPDFTDYDHVRNLLKTQSADTANSLMEDSLTYALSYAGGGLREASKNIEKLQSVNVLSFEQRT